jgi:EAL domain-containing protein (putative c-di-GMP-specific phosphodiesterase class I)
MSRQSVQTPEPIRSLKQERDRFVALAFTAADILLELDEARIIRFVVGATTGLLGREQDRLIGVALDELVAEDDRRMITAVLDRPGVAGRFEAVMVRLANPHSTVIRRAIVSGYRLPDLGGHYFLALSLPKYMVATDVATEARDVETGLISARSFAQIAKHRQQEANDIGSSYEMTLLHLERFGLLRQQLDRSLTDEFMANLTSLLRANSVVGDSAARLDQDTYSVIHGAETDVAKLREQVSRLARTVDPKGDVLGLRMATMPLDGAELGSTDVARAISFVAEQLKERKLSGRINSLRRQHGEMVDDTARRISEYRGIIRRRDFRVALQPIVDLASRQVEHYEALLRLKRVDESPFEVIIFAEQAGFIEEFDLAICRMVIDKIKRAEQRSQVLRLAVNLSARSIESESFVIAFNKLLATLGPMRDRLMFEVTETARIDDLGRANAFLQDLRRAGHRVCLDDFGSGQASFQYLRSLKVDLVKIDGSYVRNALKTDDDRKFLRAIIQLCNSLGIITVGEMIENEATANFLRSNGVQYGQGYLFGRPSVDISDFHEQTPPHK